MKILNFSSIEPGYVAMLPVDWDATPYIHGYNRENSYQVASVVIAQDAIIYDIEKPLVPVWENTLICKI